MRLKYDLKAIVIKHCFLCWLYMLLGSLTGARCARWKKELFCALASFSDGLSFSILLEDWHFHAANVHVHVHVCVCMCVGVYGIYLCCLPFNRCRVDRSWSIQRTRTARQTSTIEMMSTSNRMPCIATTCRKITVPLRCCCCSWWGCLECWEHSDADADLPLFLSHSRVGNGGDVKAPDA